MKIDYCARDIVNTKKLTLLIKNFTQLNDFFYKHHWSIMKDNYEGDSADYAITALWLISDKSFIKFWCSILSGCAKIERTEYKGNEHVILHYKNVYIDQIQQYPLFKEDFFKKSGYSDVKVVKKVHIMHKMIRKYIKIK